MDITCDCNSHYLTMIVVMVIGNDNTRRPSLIQEHFALNNNVIDDSVKNLLGIEANITKYENLRIFV